MRPSWLVDLKWLFGLLCLAAVIVAGVLYSASKLSEHDAATGIFSGVMTTFAKEGDGAEGFEELQAQAAAYPDEEFTIEGVTLPVKGKELAGLSYDDAVDMVVGRIADKLYTEGPGAVEQYFEDTSSQNPQEGSGGADQRVGLGPFSLLTQDTHDAVRIVFAYSLVAVVILAAPLVFFSRRFGRLGSPGVVLAVGTAPFTLVWLLIREASADPGGEGINGALAQALSSSAGDVFSSFLRLLILGLGLTGAAVAGHLGFALWSRFRSATAASDAQAPSAEEQIAPPDYVSQEGFSGQTPGRAESVESGSLPQA